MIRFENLSVGDTVFQSYYGGVRSGKVAAKKEGSSFRDNRICLETSDGFESVSEFAQLYPTEREAWFDRAQKAQHEAASKLNEAAQAFARAGISTEAAPTSE